MNLLKQEHQHPPKVSIGMPVFNGEKYLSRAIDSLLSQTYGNFELLISDNASTDSTSGIAQRYAAKDSRIKYFCHEKNIGALGNFRFVFENTQGDYFFWAPHDDWWDTEFIEHAERALEINPKAAGVMGFVHFFDRNGNEFMTNEPPYGLVDQDMYRRVKSYLSRDVTDLLFYSFFRRDTLIDTIWSQSLVPEKVIILHSILKGPIIDEPKMQYFNQFSFKNREDVIKMFAVPFNAPSIDTPSFTSQVFYDNVSEIKWWTNSVYDRWSLVWILFWRQHWYKHFFKRLLGKHLYGHLQKIK